MPRHTPNSQLWVLAALYVKKNHGTAIWNWIFKESKGTTAIPLPSVYDALRRLERKQLISRENKGAPRLHGKICNYVIEEKGIQVLKKEHANVPTIKNLQIVFLS